MISNKFKINKNSFTSDEDGVVVFPQGLTITDGSVQRNGTQYDIDTLDITKFPGHLTADHVDKLSSLIGNVYGLQKHNGRVTINKIVYAVKANPYARMAYDLLMGGFSDSFSTETMGDLDYGSNTYHNSELCGLSQVVTPNNYAAVVNTVHNSLEKAKNDGLDIDGIEEKFMAKNKQEIKNQMAKKQKKVNSRAKKVVNEFSMDDFKAIADQMTAATAALVNAGQQIATIATRETGEQVDNPVVTDTTSDAPESDGSADGTADAPAGSTDTEPTTSTDAGDADGSDLSTNTIDKKEKNKMTKEEIQALVDAAVKNQLDKSAKEPEFKMAENGASDVKVKSEWTNRFKDQISALYKSVKLNNFDAMKQLNEINEYNRNELVKAGKISNSFALDDMGDFILPPEMIDTIQGIRTNYDDLLNVTSWQETPDTKFWYVSRTSDVLMQSVNYTSNGDDGNGNLKPVTGPDYASHEAKLYEIAGVFPIMASALEFSAVDLLTDIATGFQHSYAKARAQLVIASLQKAVQDNNQILSYASGSTSVDRIKAFLQVVAKLEQATPNGVYVLSQRSLTQLMADYVDAGISGPLGSTILLDGTAKTINGTPYIVVPNDLLPALGSTESVSYVVNDANVTVENAVFYFDPSIFLGRTHGGLKYDSSTEASYESNGAVRSAYQRNEIVLRGSAFIGGAVTNEQFVSAITTNATVVES